VIPGVQPAGRILVVGQDADVAAALHLHLERAGWALACVPTPDLLDPVLRAVAPHAIVLMLPASPDASWGGALTTAASAARVGMRVVVVAPSRDVVEPLAAVAGAERALARAEVLAHPLSVVERVAGTAATVAAAFPPPMPARGAPPPAPVASPQPSFAAPPPVPAAAARAPRAGDVDLMALIDEELVDEPRQRPQLTRVEVNVSLVSEHNFYVGVTRRVDSGGVFISTMLPPPVGTRLQVRLGLADGRRVDAEGEVVFVREKSAISGRQPSGCGVKLHGLPGWAIDAIDRFLLARPPIAYAPR
jgi:PilZ domain-containing protein